MTAYRLEPIVDDDPLSIGCRIAEEAYTRLDKIGQGTFGHVYLARDKANKDDLVALKKVKVETDKDGFPITAIREIKILQTLKHDNIIRLREIVRSRPHVSNANRGSVYMVFDYMESDLAALLSDRTIVLSAGHIKSIMWQLLQGIAYCHEQNILHRDLKLSNLLLSRTGVLKIADLGLARLHHPSGRMTNRVITLWYRPPEILLGAEQYGTEVDMWSAGCIFGELLSGRPLFHGNTEVEQLGKIARLMGCPTLRWGEPPARVCLYAPELSHTQEEWPEHEHLPYAHFLNRKYAVNNLRQHILSSNRHVEPAALDLLSELLRYNPAHRATARSALRHPYFTSRHSLPMDHNLPWKPGSHEMLANKRNHAERLAQGRPGKRMRR